jgi:hypothetical protein
VIIFFHPLARPVRRRIVAHIIDDGGRPVPADSLSVEMIAGLFPLVAAFPGSQGIFLQLGQTAERAGRIASHQELIAFLSFIAAGGIRKELMHIVAHIDQFKGAVIADVDSRTGFIDDFRIHLRILLRTAEIFFYLLFFFFFLIQLFLKLPAGIRRRQDEQNSRKDKKRQHDADGDDRIGKSCIDCAYPFFHRNIIILRSAQFNKTLFSNQSETGSFISLLYFQRMQNFTVYPAVDPK